MGLPQVALANDDGDVVVENCLLAETALSRCRGLLGRSGLSSGEGMLLRPASSVHTAFMRFAIDVVFLSRQMRVLGLASAVAPWRVLRAPRGTGRVLELASGQIVATGLKAGTFLLVEMPRPQCERSPIRFSLRLPQRYEDATQEVTASSSRSLPQ